MLTSRDRRVAGSSVHPFARSGWRSLASALLVATATLAAVPAAQSQTVSVNGQIAYVACGPSSIPFGPTTQCDIWVMNPDGTGTTNLTNTTDEDEQNPAWSPDGTRIAYISFINQGLMVMNADGSAKRRIGDLGTSPSWSPGGTQIAVERNGDIVVVDAATGSSTTISRQVNFGGVLLDALEFEPAWSPDGGKIAYVGVREETYLDSATGQPTTGAQHEIVIANPDGSGEQIISAGAPGSDRAKYLEEDRAPAWSPDGRMLVFMSQAQIPSCCGPWQIWAVNRDGTGLTNLTNDDTVNDLWPSFSPDGTQILFQRASAGGYDLYTMPAPTALTGAAGPATATRATASAITAAGTATRLTTDGNARDSDWGRNRNAPPPGTQQYTLNVSVVTTGKGAGGTVTSKDGLRCTRDCSKSYASGTLVDLTAAPKKGTSFVGWTGACVGNAPVCRVTMTDIRIVGAQFVRQR